IYPASFFSHDSLCYFFLKHRNYAFNAGFPIDEFKKNFRRNIEREISDHGKLALKRYFNLQKVGMNHLFVDGRKNGLQIIDLFFIDLYCSKINSRDLKQVFCQCPSSGTDLNKFIE